MLVARPVTEARDGNLSGAERLHEALEMNGKKNKSW